MASNKKVELYIPRHCSITHTLVAADDHAAVQILVPHVNAEGVIEKEYATYVVKGSVRKEGISDHSLNREFQKDGFLKTVVPKNMMI